MTKTTVGTESTTTTAQNAEDQPHPASGTDVSAQQWTAKVPVCLDVMGGFCDYTGTLAIAAVLQEHAQAVVQKRDDQRVRLVLGTSEKTDHVEQIEFPLDRFYADEPDRLARPAEVLSRIDVARTSPLAHWAAVLYTMLYHQRLPDFAGGLTVAYDSEIRFQTVTASIGAAQVAAYLAVCDAFGVQVDPLATAQTCQWAENYVVGNPCGIRDYITSLLCEDGRLVQLRCQPHEIIGTLALPPGVTLCAVDSGVRSAKADEKFRDTRVAAFMGHRIISHVVSRQSNGQMQLGNYLANLSPTDFVERFRDLLPTKIKGREFLIKFGDTIDLLTVVDPDRVYKIRSRTEHHIYESTRAHQFAERLSRAGRTGDRNALIEAGEIMYASHWSYGQRCGLGGIETDLLSNLIRQQGLERGILGARVSGSGAGGTVTVLLEDKPQASDAIKSAVAEYERTTKNKARLHQGLSAGAMHLRSQLVAASAPAGRPAEV